MSSIVNKIKEAVSSDKHHHSSNTDSSSTTNEGLGHQGHRAVKADYSTGDKFDTYGSSNTAGGGFGSGPAPNTDGPHQSDMANKVDPRVDSDRDGSNTLGGSHALGRDNNTYGANTGYGVSHQSHNTAGPHRSDAANKLDPRVDSDRDGSNQYSANAGVFGTSHQSHNTAGPHRSDAANRVDPRVDSDGSNAFGGSNTLGGGYGQHSSNATSFGSGPAPNTAGPHRSDMANKVDPRVDSDRDGSKTVGRDQTYSQSDNLNPRDAADVPPSVLRKHIGEVSIEHDDHEHQRERRHSKASAQDVFRGV